MTQAVQCPNCGTEMQPSPGPASAAPVVIEPFVYCEADSTGNVTTRVARFVGIGKAVMRGTECVATARSNSMAARIAHALNHYAPNRCGL